MRRGPGGGGGGPAPALSLVLPSGAPTGWSAMTPFEVVDLERARGAWLLVWWGRDHGPLRDPGLVDKAALVAGHTDPPVVVGLAAGGRHGWEPGSDSDGGPMVGALVERRSLWRVAGSRPTRWRLFPVDAEGALEALPGPVRPPGALDRLTAALGPTAKRAVRRAKEPTSWEPPDTTPLWLGLEPRVTAPRLAVGTPAGLVRATMVGRLFTRPFWRTVPVTVRDGRLEVGAVAEPVGHVLSAGLPGMVELREAVRTTSRALGGGGEESVDHLVAGLGPVWIDVARIPPPGIWPGG